MILKLYTIYDSAAQSYSNPVYMIGRGVAFRSFQDEVAKPDSRFHQHPDDYTLFELGSFDDQTATFIFHKAPEKVAMAREVIQVIQQ